MRELIKGYTASAGEERHWEVAFYGGSFTAIPMELQTELLRPAYDALEKGLVQGLRCSTRPDCITEDILRNLKRYGLICVELGVQSMDDRVLQEAQRGHTAADVVRASALLRNHGFTVGHQLMPGLPGEDWASLRRTTKAICDLRPDMARIYPVAVLKGTELAAMYEEGRYIPLTIDEGVRRAAYMKQHFLERGISCIRTGLQATEDLDDTSQVLAGAYTPAMGELVDTYRYRKQLLAFLRTLSGDEAVTVSYHRRETSRVRGYRSLTVKTARWSIPLTLSWREGDVPLGHVRVFQGQRGWDLDMNSHAGPTMI